jgi:peptidoglycan/xylan/chitin deacetylase (PgdA/CDA1 family)
VAITVAVCHRTGSPTLAQCLSALRSEGVHPVVFTSPRGHGLAQSRNDALASTDADVLAFVDDDIAVGDGWFGALRAAWSRAPEDRGCVGGPIGARFTAPRPRWLTDPLLGVLGVADGGNSFHGGNVSFRTDALRGIGGFWPVRGRPELHDWFSEEHHAQHELAAAGWSHACEPDAAVTRLLDPSRLHRRDVLALRARYGARSALIGERRPRAVAARTAASSAAGAAIAMAARDDARATERAARAAENAAVLVAPLIAHRDLQPTVAQTPFRHSVPAPQPLIPRVRLRRSRSGAVVLVYHRVDHEPGSVTPANFAAQMEVMLSRSTPAPLEAIARGDAPSDAFAVTFDDGYAETMHQALPVLTSAGVPATIFISTVHVAEQHGFWWDEVGHLLAQSPARPLRLTIEGETRAWARAAGAERHLLSWLQPKSPEAIEAALVGLRGWASGEAELPEAERPLSVAELRTLSRSPLIDIGAHTRTHANLRYVNPARLIDELSGSRADLAQWLGIASPSGLAYPFGVPGIDVDDGIRAAARTAGFDYAALNTTGIVTADTDRYGLPRLPPENTGADAFVSVISRATGRFSR